MRITSSSGANILCDPWINPGAFLGSWFHWPPLPEDLESLLLTEPCNGVYITHLHPDHYDPKFLAKFTKLRPEVPVYISEFSHQWLKRSVVSVVNKKTNVIEIPTLGTVEIEKGFSLKVFAADTCNPKICGSNIPCQTDAKLRGIDSIGVFQADGLIVVNANDAMGVKLVPQIAANIGKANFIMGHYGGASPYPQCFPDVNDKYSACKKVVESTCKMLVSAANALGVEKIMPFAGQYILGGNLVNLNDSRATIPLDKAVEYLQQLTDKEVVSVVPGGSIDLTEKWQDEKYSEPSESIKKAYMDAISQAKFPYESYKETRWENIENDLILAASPIASRSKFAKILAEISFVIGDGISFVTINLDPRHKLTGVTPGKNPIFSNVTTITMPTQLLRILSSRRKGYAGFTPIHWNQADVGSHFTWTRKGDYNLPAHQLLNFYGI